MPIKLIMTRFPIISNFGWMLSFLAIYVAGYVINGQPDNPLVSVVMPVYNRDYLLERSINSIRNQTYTNWELIIVDDASTNP